MEKYRFLKIIYFKEFFQNRSKLEIGNNTVCLQTVCLSITEFLCLIAEDGHWLLTLKVKQTNGLKICTKISISTSQN